jgi:hypothetical protein
MGSWGWGRRGRGQQRGTRQEARGSGAARAARCGGVARVRERLDRRGEGAPIVGGNRNGAAAVRELAELGKSTSEHRVLVRERALELLERGRCPLERGGAGERTGAASSSCGRCIGVPRGASRRRLTSGGRILSRRPPRERVAQVPSRRPAAGQSRAFGARAHAHSGSVLGAPGRCRPVAAWTGTSSAPAGRPR